MMINIYNIYNKNFMLNFTKLDKTFPNKFNQSLILII